MSKRIEATITCPNCAKQFLFTLYRTIWGEYEENKKLVLSDQINVSVCPSCKTRTKIPYPFMYVDVKKQFAIWWEPEYDSQIDKDALDYAKIFGDGNFYHKAPRIKNWEEFKKLVIKYDSGELKANSIRLSQPQQEEFTNLMKSALKDLQKKNKKGSGCLSTMIFLLTITAIIIYESFK